MSKYEVYINTWRKRLSYEAMQTRNRIERMRRVAAQCTELLASKYDVERIYLFGSLVGDRLTHDRSDIDLAVAGLASRSYFPALADLWDILPHDLTLDLIPLEDAYTSLKERVLKEGKLLYERK